MKHLRNQHGMVDLLLVILVIAVLAVGGYALYFRHVAQGNKVDNTVTLGKSNKKTVDKVVPPTNPYAGWLTYTSKTEKSHFMYPKDWKVGAKPSSVDPNADTFAISSPSGAITVEWVSVVSGLGGVCDTDGANKCPTVKFLSISKLSAVSSLAIAEATVTSDDKTYTPILAILDDKNKVGTVSGMFYSVFTAKNNGGMNAELDVNGLSTVKPTKLYKADAEAYFDKPEVKTAKLILQSYSY